MPRIFISYRRKDSRKDTGRIYDRLVEAFGRANIFKDVDNIPPGSSYPEELDKAIAASDIFLVMIGPQWIDIRDDAGNRRLDDATDPVRLEIERGLQQGDSLRMIPVLVDDAVMPTAAQLPESMRPLAFKNAVVVRDDPDFNRDVERLIAYVRQSQGTPTRMKRGISPIWVAVIVAVLIGGGLLIAQALRPPSPPEATETATYTQTIEASAVVVVVDTETPTETSTSTHTPTEEPTSTRTDTPTDEPSPTASFTTTHTDLPTGTFTPSRTPSDTPTPELEALAMTFEAEQSATAGHIETLTATAWTSTPTANATRTFAAFLTQRAAANLTATADSWTDTPTNTPTRTYTRTPTFTLTPTPSRTPTNTRTFTPSPTLTPSNTPIPLGYSGNPVTQNADWTPVVQQIDGVEMVLVPAGCFNMGSDDADNYPDELPVHEICFDAPFWIDQTEVTNRQFTNLNGDAFVSSIYTGAPRPRDNVNWIEARDFCILRGGRLPTEAEWEYAARGPDSLLFPWGDDWNPELAVVGRAVGAGTQDVGSIPENASWVGAFDMTGNLWEWTASAYLPYPFNATARGHEEPDEGEEAPDRVLRGSSWYNPEARVARAPYRAYIAPETRNPAYGFRCVREFEG